MNNDNEQFLTISTDDINAGADSFKPLDEGSYEAVCIGITVNEMQNFDKTAKEDKIIFVYQIRVDGINYYLKSAPNKKSLHEKSGLWKILSSWTKQPDASTLISKMGTGGKFVLKYFLGKPIQLTVKTKLVGTKTYNFISDYMSPKKGQSTTIAPDAIPAYIVAKVKSQDFVAGITIKEEKAKVVVAPTPTTSAKKAPAKAEVEEDEDKELPF